MRNQIGKLKYRVSKLLGNDYVIYEGLTLPPRQIRFGGDIFQSDESFASSGRKEAQRLIERCGLLPHQRVLDVGCGPGRLATGLLSLKDPIQEYVGVDINRTALDWCNRHLAAKNPKYRFVLLDLFNPRYNKSGSSEMVADFKLPLNDSPKYEVIYLYSVFSHLLERDVRLYLKEFQRLLTDNGTIFLTAFLEKGVDPVVENPDGYRRKWNGPLHCVRYDHDYFSEMLKDNGFFISGFDYETETDGQTAVYVRKTVGNGS